MDRLALNLQSYPESEEVHRADLQEKKTVLGPDHPDTLKNMYQLAVTLSTGERYREAEELFRVALEGRTRVLGLDHPDTLWSMRELAIVLHHQQKYREAEELYRTTLEGMTKVLRPDHPDIFKSMCNLASTLAKQEKCQEAEELYRAALEGITKALTSDRPDTLASMTSLADVSTFQEVFHEAEELYRTELEGRTSVLGPDHPDTLSSMTSLADASTVQEKFHEAEELYRTALEGRTSVLGPDHPDTLISTSGLAVVLHCQGKYHEAEEFCRTALEGRTRVLGPGHPDTLSSTSGLAAALNCQGKYHEAEELYRTALEGMTRVLGPDHPDTLSSTSDLAAVLHCQGKCHESEELYRTALERRTRVLGPDHPDTLSSTSGLAAVLHYQGKYLEAEGFYRTALEVMTRALGPDHPDTLASMNSLVDVLIVQQKFEDAWLYLDHENHLSPLVHRHLAACMWFAKLHSLHSEAAGCPIDDFLEPHQLAQSICEVVECHQHLYSSALDSSISVDYLVGEITGDEMLIRVLPNTSETSQPFRDQIARWAKVCHPKLPHLSRFATSICDVDGAAFMTFMCPLPNGNPGTNEAQLRELFHTMELFSRNFYHLFLEPEDRQVVVFSTLRRLGYILSEVVTRRRELAIFLVSEMSFDDLELSESFTSEPRSTLLMDLVQCLLDNQEHILPPRILSRAFQLLRRITLDAQSLPQVLQISYLDITEISEQPITTGGNSDIYRGEYMQRSVALKILRVSKNTPPDKLHSVLAREALFWRYLNHPNLLPLLGYCPEKDACLITEWMLQGSLASFIQSYKACDCLDPKDCQTLEHQERDVKLLSLQVARGLAYIHQVAGIIHGDLRADNVLIDEQFNARITDFGLSMLISDVECETQFSKVENRAEVHTTSGSRSYHYAGAPRWLAPEYVVKGRSKHVPGDVYAWGCVFLEIFTGERPFPWCTADSQALLAIETEEKPWRLCDRKDQIATLDARGLTSEACRLAESCWATNFSCRPKMLTVCRKLGKMWNLKWDDPYLSTADYGDLDLEQIS